jgi:hypothetical protein
MKKSNPFIVFTVVLLSLLISGINCSILFVPDTGQQVDENEDKPNAYTCRCICEKRIHQRDKTYERDFNVCMTDELNPNVEPDLGVMPTDDDLREDCSSRVRDVAVGIANRCVSPEITIDDCVCEPFLEQRFVNVCNGECVNTPLELDCSNREQASSVAGSEPVCLAEETQEEEAQGLGNALFRRSTCDVKDVEDVKDGITVDREGEEPQTKGTEGVVEFIGEPCPGEECDIGMSVQIDKVGTFSFGGFFGFFDVDLKNVLVSGTSLETITLDSSGEGTFQPLTFKSSGRGRIDCPPLGCDDEEAAYVAKNTEGTKVIVDWDNRVCAVDGTLFTTTIEGKKTDVKADFTGEIVNTPPKANAGPDRAVECTSPSGASVELDASDSNDLEDNIVLYQWWLGERPGGEEIGDIQEDLEAVVYVDQKLGIQEYSVIAQDEFWQISGDTATVNVVDTSAPTINCPSDKTLECESGGASLFFNSTASDICFENPPVSCNPDSGSFFPLGNSISTCTATDSAGNKSSCSFNIKVEDTKPPEIVTSVSIDSLWPTNHKMVDVGLSIDVTDKCDLDPDISISVTSDEPTATAAGAGGSQHAPDAEITDNKVYLRAERSGEDDGRVYIINVTATDASGNSASSSASVKVNHNKKKDAVNSGQNYDAAQIN